MPKYSVEEVIDIIKTLTPEEKIALQAELPSVLSATESPQSSDKAKNQQSQSFGNINLGNGSAFDVNQIAAEGSVNLARATTQSQAVKREIEEALDLLQSIKQEVGNSDRLDKLEQKNVESAIALMTEELQKSKPDKKLLAQCGQFLQTCLSGIERLAGPTLQVIEILGTVGVLGL
jgi:hypothetical protein